uniref:Uncharacterized protein n=1 Tax=Anguilla anguilla TaxID=7936 RepID=A0A0E9R7B1_ANGAN
MLIAKVLFTMKFTPFTKYPSSHVYVFVTFSDPCVKPLLSLLY